MISVYEAKKLLEENVKTATETAVPIELAVNMVCARDMAAAFDSPPFDKSAMDGFAVAEIGGPANLEVVGIIKAGDKPVAIKKGTCVKVMTGAALPAGTTAVVPKEDAVENGRFITIKKDVLPGQFVRKKGGEIKKGGRLFSAGEILKPASVGLLASQGIAKANVFRRPTVSILTTGNEIARLGQQTGQIFDANFYSLSAALAEHGLKANDLGISMDEISDLKFRISKGLKSDILIISGGVSVGEFDFVKNILAELSVRQVFWQVAQKPGKPLYFGVQDGGGLVFGVPGNPASAIVCFYEYVLPAIRKTMGMKNIWPVEVAAELDKPYENKTDRIEFLLGIYEGRKVRLMPENESHMLKNFAVANCLVMTDGRKHVVHLI